MLDRDDIAWIKANRSELLAGRTETITIVREIITGEDPYTGEPIIKPEKETVQVVWKEVESVANTERNTVSGVELEENDVAVSFPVNIDLTTVKDVIRESIKYRIVTVDLRGLGEPNRQETIMRRVT